MGVLRRDPVRVLVPASSANLGPAFDCAGLALGVFDELVAMVSDDPGVLVEVAGHGEDEVPRDESHLVARAMTAAFDALGADVAGFVLRTRNAIPHGRGLGSSAAAVIGGLVLARAMVEGGPDDLPDLELLQLGLTFESHPDNLAAALFGGLTLAWLDGDGRADAVRLDPHPALRPVLFVPTDRLATTTARSMMPPSVPLDVVTSNICRTALLFHAATQAPEHLFTATSDRLHQQCRAAAYPRTAELVDRLRAIGEPAVVSGAGPSVLVLTTDVERARSVDPGPDWSVHAVDVAGRGAVVAPLP